MTTNIKDFKDDDESSYHCPIHPEIPKKKPGACSRCGMFLIKDTTDEQWKGDQL